jgi:hypothetical protein
MMKKAILFRAFIEVMSVIQLLFYSVSPIHEVQRILAARDITIWASRLSTRNLQKYFVFKA